MRLSCIKSRKLDRIPDKDGAKQLAQQMQESGEESLSLDVENSPVKSLRFLEHLPFLKYLDVGGKVRHLEAIAALTGLRELCLMRVTVPDFKFLAGLNELRLFDMRFGGCKAFDTLSAAKNLIGLALMRLPSLKNLDFVKAMSELQLLEVDSCKGISRMPDFSKNPALRKIKLETMNGLASLKNIEKANQLEYLVVMETKTLPSSEFKRIVNCPSLRKVLVGPDLMTSARYREAVSYVPEELQMDGYYGTEFEKFSFQGDYQPVESE